MSIKGMRRRKEREDSENTINAVNAVKMVSLLVLRNEGWKEEEILDFNKKFDEVLVDVMDGWLSLSDIPKALKDEIGININEILL